MFAFPPCAVAGAGRMIQAVDRNASAIQFGPITLVPGERVLLKDGRPVGLIDITDVVGTGPAEVQGPRSKVQGRSESTTIPHRFRLLTPDS